VTNAAELKKREESLNLAIVHTEPYRFAASLTRWLEIIARMGQALNACAGCRRQSTDPDFCSYTGG
jgi:hypothetical protein